MLERDSSYLEEFSWKQIRGEVIQVAPELATIIDNLNPGDNYKLIRATYSYGDLIVNNGVLGLPDNQGRVIPITDTNSSNKFFAGKLSYSPIPLFLTLEKSNEVLLILTLELFLLIYLILAVC